jgi:hypothetical protein
MTTTKKTKIKLSIEINVKHKCHQNGQQQKPCKVTKYFKTTS